MNEDLIKFIYAVNDIKKQPRGIVNLGLIISETKSKSKGDDILKEIKSEEKIDSIVYDKKCSDENLAEKITECFTDGKWIFIELKKDPGTKMLSMLKDLSNSNSFKAVNKDSDALSEIKMPEKSRVVVFAERKFIEKNITYPYFYNIFGLVLSIK